MKKLIVISLAMLIGLALSAAPLSTEQKALVDAQIKIFAPLGSDPEVVKAVKAYNATPYAELKGMTQDAWAKLSVLSAEIKLLTKNDLVTYLKTKRSEVVSELFVNAANGQKVAFFSKTTSWNHSGKAKHDQPMAGKTWIGEPELDESTGKQSVQFSFPVLDGGKAIGSIVIGLDLSKLK